jgi:hypothetical protein
MGAVTLKLNNHDSGKHHLHHCKTNGSLAFFFILFIYFINTQDGIVHHEFTLHKEKL